jgi:CBS domain-containing protein
MKIRDVMTPDVDVVTSEDTLTTATHLMADLALEALPVSDDNRLIGVITGSDIAMRVVAEGCDPKQVTVGQAMTFDPLYCFANERVSTVAQKMTEWWVRRLPVVNHDKRLIGVVSLADLTAAKAASGRKEGQTHFHRLRPARSARQMRRTRRTAAAA